MAKFTQDIAPKYRAPTNLVESGLNLASRGESFSASVAEGFDSMVGALGSGGQQWLAGHLDKTMFNESDYKVDKPEIERLKSQGVPLEDDRDYTVSQVNLIKDRFYRNLGRQSRINDKFAYSNFVGSALPELANPTNFIPFGRGVTGIRALGSTVPKVSKKAKYMAEGKKVRSAFEAGKQVGIDALVGNAAIEPFYYMDARHQGKEHTLGNSLLNVGFGTAIGAGFFGSVTAGLQFRETGRFFSEAQLYEDLYSFMETGQLDKAANVLFQNSKPFRKAVQREKVFAEKVKDALDSDGVLRTDDMSDQELGLLLSIVEKYTQKSLVSALQQSMTRHILKNFAKDEQNLTIEQFSRKYRDSFLKIHEAVNTNTFDAYLKLNRAEQEIAQDLIKEFIFQDKDLAASSMVEGEEAPWFDPETGEILPEPQAPETPDVIVSYEAGVSGVRRAEAEGKGVNVLRKAGEQHYGNPFSHLPNARDAVKTGSLEETVEAYRAWLEGTDHTDVKQERRQWVLDQIDSGALDGKKLLYYSKQTPNHAEVLAEFIRKRRGAETPRASDAPKAPSFRTKILKMRELRKLALDMSQLRKDHKSGGLKPTMQEMVEQGIITKKQADAYISRFNKQYGKLYKQHIEVANRVVNNIFGKEFTLRLEEVLEPKYNTLLGMFKEREGADTLFLARMDHMLIAQSDPFSVIVHEAVHALQRYDVESYNKIRQAIAENPLLEAEIQRLVGDLRNYDPQDIEAELPSVLLEWAITQKGFWQALNDSDPTVFQKLKRAITQLFRDARRLFFNRQSHQDIFSDKNLKKLLEEDSPAELATKIGNILAEARAKRGAEGVLIDAIDSVTENANRVARITSEEIKDPKKSRFLEQNSFKSTFDANSQLRQVRRDSFLQLAALVYGKTSQAELDDLLDLIPYLEEPKEVFVERLQKLLGEDLKFGDDIVNLLYNITKKRAAISKLASNSKKLKNGMSGLDIELRRELSRIEGDDFDAFQARQEAVDGYYTNKMMAILNDSFIEIALKERLDDFKTDQQKLAFLRSYLDGQERKGTTGEFGLENKIITDSQAAAMPLMDVLAEYDLLELFMPDGTMGWLKAFKNKNKLASWRIFGRDAKQASAEFHKQLHQALIDRKLPEAWEKYEGLRVLFETLQATEFKLLKDLNSAGIQIGMLEDFGGVSQKWDVDIIKSMSREAFVADLLPKLDVEATKRAIGLLEKDKDGNDIFDAKKFLGEWYDELISEQRVAEDIQVLDLDSLFTSRLVRILPESAVDVASKYSGYDSIGHLIIQQIQRRAAVATIAQNAGLQPNKLLKKLAEGLDVKGKTTYSNKGAYIATVNKLTGILENPVDVHVSKIGDFIQKFSNLVFLSGSGLSSLTDIPLIASTLEMQGIKFGQNNKEFWETWQESMARKFEDPNQMRSYFLSMGAGFDILNNAVIRRLSDASGGKSGIDRLNSLLFKVNGLNAFTATHQEMYVDMLTRALARDISPEFKVNLIENGFTDKDIEYMQSKREKGPDGISRVDPRNLRAPVAKKLRLYMTKYMRQAVIVPDIGTKAQMTMGFRKGTVEGEVARVVTQYQPFMAAMTKLLYRRFKNGSFGKTKDNATMYKMAHLVTYLGTALAFGYMVTVLKDLARGEKPIFLTDMTPFTFKRVVSQSGVLGILQVPVDAATGSGPAAAVSPFPATMFGLAWDTATGDVDGAMDSAQTFAGGDMYGVQSVYSLLGLVFTEALNEIQLNELDNIED